MSSTYQIGSSSYNPQFYKTTPNPQFPKLNTSKDQKISELRSKLDSLLQKSKDYDSLHNRYKQLLNEYSALNEAKLRIEYEIQQRESEYNRRIYDLKAENQTLQLGLNSKSTNSKKMSNENDIIMREIGLKNEEIINLSERLNDISSQYDKHCLKNNDFVNLTQSLNKDLLNQKEEISKLKEDNMLLTQICQENEKYLKQGENEAQILYNNLEENSYDLQNLNKKVISQENILNKLKEKFNSCKKSNIELQNRIQKIEKDFDENREENDNLKNELINERTSRIKAESDNQKLNNVLIMKETELDQINNENEKIKLINDQYGRSKENNKNQNDKLKNQVILLESQNDNIIKQIDEILEEDRKMKKIVARKSRISSLLKDNNDTLEKSLNDLEASIHINDNNNQYQQSSPRFTYIYDQK